MDQRRKIFAGLFANFQALFGEGSVTEHIINMHGNGAERFYNVV